MEGMVHPVVVVVAMGGLAVQVWEGMMEERVQAMQAVVAVVVEQVVLEGLQQHTMVVMVDLVLFGDHTVLVGVGVVLRMMVHPREGLQRMEEVQVEKHIRWTGTMPQQTPAVVVVVEVVITQQMGMEGDKVVLVWSLFGTLRRLHLEQIYIS